MTECAEGSIPIIIVSFRNPDDISDVLHALSQLAPEPASTVYICENGGTKAFDDLISRLSEASSPVIASTEGVPPVDAGFSRLSCFRMRNAEVSVFVGDAGANLGYAGGINRWLRPLLTVRWPGVFILNPDAAPAPDALAIMKAYAEAHGKGMVAGRIVLADRPDLVQTRGLRWLKWRAITQAIGRHATSGEKPDINALEQIMEAPSGAASYVQRACIEGIGLMREDYFLYFEDLDWGLRAKNCYGIGYAYDALIVHKGGTTIGSGTALGGSPFSAYMDFRNAMIFVRDNLPGWYGYTVLIRLARVLRLMVVGRPDKASAALRGLWDGLRGRRGRPDEALASLLPRQ